VQLATCDTHRSTVCTAFTVTDYFRCELLHFTMLLYCNVVNMLLYFLLCC